MNWSGLFVFCHLFAILNLPKYISAYCSLITSFITIYNSIPPRTCCYYEIGEIYAIAHVLKYRMDTHAFLSYHVFTIFKQYVFKRNKHHSPSPRIHNFFIWCVIIGFFVVESIHWTILWVLSYLEEEKNNIFLK